MFRLIQLAREKMDTNAKEQPVTSRASDASSAQQRLKDLKPSTRDAYVAGNYVSSGEAKSWRGMLVGLASDNNSLTLLAENSSLIENSQLKLTRE
jgi:hypothetical protein